MSWIAVVRHGETAWNAERRLQGHSELSLNGAGRWQARSAAELLKRAPVTGVLSSPLGRAKQTAAIIAHELGQREPAIDERLLERGYGEAEGLTIVEAERRWPQANYPGAESLSALSERAAITLRNLVDERQGVTVVGHGAFLRAGISELCGISIPRILNGQVLILRRLPHRWRCEKLPAPCTAELARNAIDPLQAPTV